MPLTRFLDVEEKLSLLRAGLAEKVSFLFGRAAPPIPSVDWYRLHCPANFVSPFWIFLGYFEIFTMDFVLAHGKCDANFCT